jgi:hypothetical protein
LVCFGTIFSKQVFEKRIGISYYLTKKHFMKKIFILLAVAASIVACKQKKQNGSDQTLVLSATDSAELKEFKDWKAKKDANEKRAESRTTGYNSNANGAAAKNTSATAAVTKRKGWSKAAKGTVIGAGSGAVAGAIINKRNRAAGAAIGAVIGGGVGYGIGRSQDKKDDRH